MNRLAASPKNIRRVKDMRDAYPNKLGPKLGLLVYAANVPVSAVAEVLDVTEATFYRWIFGQCEISEDNRPKVMVVGKKISSAVKAKTLPVYGGLNHRRAALLSAIQD